MTQLKNFVWECAVWNDWSVQETGDLFTDFLARGQSAAGVDWRLKIATGWLEFRAKNVVLPESQSLDLRCGPMEEISVSCEWPEDLPHPDDAPQSRLTIYYLPGDSEDSQVSVGELVLHDDALSHAGWHLLCFDLDPYAAHSIFDRDCEEFLRQHLARGNSEDAEIETEISLNEDGLRLFLRAPVQSEQDLKLAVQWGLKIAENVGSEG